MGTLAYVMGSADLSVVTEMLSLLSTSSSVHVWRGQSDSRWPLQPGLYRRIREFSESAQATAIDEATCTVYETDLLCESNGMGYYQGDRLATMVMLQHHGGATRFLDVTRNLFAALWFATATPDDADGIIHHFSIQPERAYSYYEGGSWDSIVDPRHAGRPILYFPRPIDERIKAQQSGFLTTVLAGTCAPAQDFVEAGNDIEIHKILVPSAAKNALRRYLNDSHGVNGYSIYPDFAGYAQANAASFPFPRGLSELYDGHLGLFPSPKP